MMHRRLPLALARAQSRLVGRSPGSRRRAAEALRSSGHTEHLVQGFGPGPKITGEDVTDDDALVVLVSEKLPPGRLARSGIARIPRTFAALPTDVIDRPAADESTAAGAASLVARPGCAVKHALGAEIGSLACVLEHGGGRWIMSASHVMAPTSVFPQPGDEVWVGSRPAGTLHGWSAVAPFATVAADVAVAETDLPVTLDWPDETPFNDPRDYDPTNGPFTFYGYASGAQTAAGEAVQPGTVCLDVTGVGPVLYTGTTLLATAAQGGDSGSAVRDAGGHLVGMVVGCTHSGQACVTPWQALAPVMDVLIG